MDLTGPARQHRRRGVELGDDGWPIDRVAGAKLILLGRNILALSPADLGAIADSLIVYAVGERPGPVAIVASNALNLDMCVFLKQRVGARPFSIFVDVRNAVAWLGSCYPPGPAVWPAVATAFPTAGARRWSWAADLSPGVGWLDFGRGGRLTNAERGNCR